MPRKKKLYLTLDTETCTLPFAIQLAKTPKEKQKIAIAKPLVYDIGWCISDRDGNILKTENFLVQETFFVPQVFNTAYYKDKRPKYMEMYKKGEIGAKTWNEIIEILLADLRVVDLTTAYNACFDFKKAIPFTERYISHLYSDDYTRWEEQQYRNCKKIIEAKNDSKNSTYLEPVFKLRGEEFEIVDLWGMACDRLINEKKYCDFCLENNLLTASAKFFKTSAETSFQYLMRNREFVEDHTALSDALIEAQILSKGLKKGKVEPNITPFPFRTLGTTSDYVMKYPKHIDIVLDAYAKYIEDNDGERRAEEGEFYWRGVINTYEKLAAKADE